MPNLRNLSPAVKGLLIGLILSVITLLCVNHFYHVWGLGLITLVAYMYARPLQDKWKVATITVCIVFMWGFVYNVPGTEVFKQASNDFFALFYGFFSWLHQMVTTHIVHG